MSFRSNATLVEAQKYLDRLKAYIEKRQGVYVRDEAKTEGSLAPVPMPAARPIPVKNVYRSCGTALRCSL